MSSLSGEKEIEDKTTCWHRQENFKYRKRQHVGIVRRNKNRERENMSAMSGETFCKQRKRQPIGSVRRNINKGRGNTSGLSNHVNVLNGHTVHSVQCLRQGSDLTTQQFGLYKNIYFIIWSNPNPRTPAPLGYINHFSTKKSDLKVDG